MKKLYFILLLPYLLSISCKSGNKETKNFISIVSIIEKQVAHVDTSLYSIKKIITTDNIYHDTVYIPREDFKVAAKEFLEIPDLSVKKIASNFKEEAPRYDEMLGRVIIAYTAINPEEEYKSQELLITPDELNGDKINNIIVNRVIISNDSIVDKNLLWLMDKSFQITTTIQKPGSEDKTSVVKVSWNEEN